MSEVIIDLRVSKDAIAYEEKGLIHQKEFKEAKRLISERYAKVLAMVDNEPLDHFHETITILGPRGSGKTTFLLSLLKKYKEDSEFCVLDIIDPTLIEEKGHIFLNVLSAINDRVENELEERQKRSNKILEVSEKWQELLSNLSKGLPSMDGIAGAGFENNWQDPGYIMDNGIKSVSSARNLNRNFSKLVSFALDVLGKKVFLITFDDIDINFKKGWPVLETIRKYFISSKIISILSGDLRLYSLAVRKQHWQNFGKALLKNEADRLGKMDYYKDLITEMESQYMLKVLKPERRIHLATLYEKIGQFENKLYQNVTKSKELILVRYKDQEVDILFLYKLLLSRFGIKNGYQAEVYSSFLLSLPLRTQIQLLSEFVEHENDLQQANFIDPFLSDMLEKNVDINLITSSPKLLNVEILKLLLKERFLGELYQLQPSTVDMSLNSSVFTLSLLLSQRISNSPYLIFDYLIKIGYVRNLLTSFNYLDEDETRSLYSKPSIEGLCKHSGIFQDKVLRDIAGNITAYIKGAFPEDNLWGGMIPLLGLGILSKKSEESISDRIDKVFQNEPAYKRVLGYMPLSVCAYTTKNQTLPYYSVYTLIATIGECIRKVELNDLNKGLAELSQIRTYSMPEFVRANYEGNDSSIFITAELEDQSQDVSELIEFVTHWVLSFPGSYALSPHLLGKISTRFFYALNSIENTEENTHLGEMMHVRITALLNAVLLEEAREYSTDFRGFNNNNTNLKDDVFFQNLNAALNSGGELLFSRWILSCPLLLFYLRPSRKLVQLLSAFTSEKNPLNTRDYTIYHQLKEVTVRGNKERGSERRSSFDNRYSKIIEVLRSNQVPFELFIENVDRGAILNNNRIIRQTFQDLLREEDWSSGQIRNFRKYLKRNKIQW